MFLLGVSGPETLKTILEIQFALAYTQTLAWNLSEEISLAEFNWIWKRFLDQKETEKAPPDTTNGLGGDNIVPRFEFLQRGS